MPGGHLAKEVDNHLKAVESAIRKNLAEQVSMFKLGLERGDLNVSIEMDPPSGKVRVYIRQYHRPEGHTGGDIKKGFCVDLNLNQLPDLQPGYELTRLVPEDPNLANKLHESGMSGDSTWPCLP